MTNNVKNLRENLGWSQSQLARHSGVTQAAISYYESGEREPSYDQAVLLATAMLVSVSDVSDRYSDAVYVPVSRLQDSAAIARVQKILSWWEENQRHIELIEKCCSGNWAIAAEAVKRNTKKVLN